MEDHGQDKGHYRNPESDPRPDGVRLPEAALQFVLSQKSVTDSALIIPSSDPFTQFFIRFFSEFVRVFFSHAPSQHLQHPPVKRAILSGCLPLSKQSVSIPFSLFPLTSSGRRLRGAVAFPY